MFKGVGSDAIKLVTRHVRPQVKEGGMKVWHSSGLSFGAHMGEGETEIACLEKIMIVTKYLSSVPKTTVNTTCRL